MPRIVFAVTKKWGNIKKQVTTCTPKSLTSTFRLSGNEFIFVYSGIFFMIIYCLLRNVHTINYTCNTYLQIIFTHFKSTNLAIYNYFKERFSTGPWNILVHSGRGGSLPLSIFSCHSSSVIRFSAFW